MYAYVIRLLGIALLVLGFTGEAAAQTTVWRDSLQVRIDTSRDNKPKIVDNKLVFSIQVLRPNRDWNNLNDTILGDADLYFNFNPDAFKGKGSPRFIPAAGIAIDENLTGSVNSLWAEARYWAWRMQVAFRIKNKGTATKFVSLPLKEWVTLGRVEWPCDPAYAKLGVVWDKPATGLMTLAGDPIIDTLLGDIIKNPDDALQILTDTLYPNPVCAGETVEFICSASSSGTGLTYIWEYSKDNNIWAPINTVIEGSSAAHNIGGVPYEIKNGDTLRLKEIPNKFDGYWFRCTAEDKTLTTIQQRVGETHRLNVRDSVWGFISRDANQPRLAGVKDTVTQCSNTNAMMRFNFYGIDDTERNDVDSIYYTYIYWNTSGQPTLKTDTFSVVNGMQSYVFGGSPIFYAAKKAMGAGRYELKEIKTKYCNNAAIATQYDTLYIKEGDFTELPRLTVKVNETDKVIDADFSAWGNVTPVVTTIAGKGTATVSGTQVKYNAPAVPCTDTVFYEVTGMECQLTREIDVINNQYLSLKVLLEGPYVGKKNGVDSMRCISKAMFNKYTMDPAGKGYVSPYADKMIIEEMPKLTGGTLCDWVYVKIRDGVKGNYVDSVSAFLRQDGVVCDTAGKPYLSFNKLEKNAYYIVVEHRNHLGAMSKDPVTLKSTATDINMLVDFSNKDNVYQKLTVLPVKYNKSGVYVLYGGDLNRDGLISVQDQNNIIKSMKKIGYNVEDLNADISVSTLDENIVIPNISKIKQY